MQHLAPVTSPNEEGCYHCGGLLSREWGVVDTLLPEFISSTRFCGFKNKYVFKNDTRGTGYYFDYVMFGKEDDRKHREFFGRGQEHNKCREPFGRRLQKMNPNCLFMNLGQACDYATKYCIVRQPHKQPNKTACKRIRSDETFIALTKITKPNDEIIQDILYASNNKVSDDVLKTIASKVTMLTRVSEPKTRDEIIELLCDYYNWKRHLQDPAPPRLSWTMDMEDKIIAAQCLSSFSSSSV